jgi:YD repeat-containing protein
MGRITVLKRAVIVSAALLSAFLLGACSNPFNIFNAVQTEVMRANDKFLLVSGAGPAKNAANVNPAEPIWIEFDRDINTETITPESITFTPAAEWNFSYDGEDRRLSITATLDGLVEYRVAVTTAVEGMDESSLEDAYSWSFTTADLPAGNIVINEGDAYIETAGSNVTLTVTYNSAVDEMRYSWEKDDFEAPEWGWVGKAPTINNFPLLDAGIGTHTIYIQFRDDDLNRTGDPSDPGSNYISDSIINGAVTITPCLNTAAKGTVALSWTAATREDSGDNIYRVYDYRWMQSGKYWYWRHVLMGETTGSSISLNVDQGTVYNLDVRIYNDAVGGYGEYSNKEYGFSSDMVVIYDDVDSTDTALAQQIKTALTTNLVTGYPGTVTGAMPVWTVTLFPEDFVSTTYTASNVVHGDPVIVTHGTSIYSNSNQSRNISAHGHGVIGQGYGGTRLLDTLATNWAGWGFSGTSPSAIGYGDGITGIANNALMYTVTNDNSVWTTPLQSTVFPGGPSPVTHDAVVQISYANVNRRSVFLNDGVDPTDGFAYGRDYEVGGTEYFTVVRQGRCLHFGFYGLPDRPITGYVYWVNLVSRMKSY